jgi:dCTP deaminase
MVLSDIQLREWGYHGGLTPYHGIHVNPASVDLTWSGRYKRAPRKRSLWDTSELGFSDGCCDVLSLQPDAFYLLDTAEYVVLPASCCGLLTLKSSTGRRGLALAHAGFVDPGFEGTLTFGLSVMVPWPVSLECHDRLVQLVLMQMQSEPEAAYAGHYQRSREPMAAWAVAGE